MLSWCTAYSIGNPDTYFRRNDGKYIFVVYTTQQARIFSKIQEDILSAVCTVDGKEELHLLMLDDAIKAGSMLV